jgi:hypothetical protein
MLLMIAAAAVNDIHQLESDCKTAEAFARLVDDFSQVQIHPIRLCELWKQQCAERHYTLLYGTQAFWHAAMRSWLLSAIIDSRRLVLGL